MRATAIRKKPNPRREARGTLYAPILRQSERHLGFFLVRFPTNRSECRRRVHPGKRRRRWRQAEETGFPAAIVAPIRQRHLAEAFVIEDGEGIAIAYVYFRDDASRGGVSKRLSRAEAEEAGKMMAGAIGESLRRAP